MESIVVTVFVGDDVLGTNAEPEPGSEGQSDYERKRGRHGPCIAHPVGEILLGRAATNGFSIKEEWVPRVLATLVPTERCWLVVNGPSTRMRVENDWVDCTTAIDSVVALPHGVSDLRWPSLVDPIRVRLDVGGDVGEAKPLLRPERDDVDEVRLGMARTARALGEQRGHDILKPSQRRAMAELFRHLLVEDEPRPANLIESAAERLGMQPEALKKRASRVREKVNGDRFQKLANLDQLGEYLVWAGAVTVADLDLLTVRPRRRRPGAAAQ